MPRRELLTSPPTVRPTVSKQSPTNLAVCYKTAMNALRLVVLPILVLVPACGGTPPPDPDYLASVEAWRDQREARLRADDGWLTLVGLHWLDEGENTLGSSADADVVLPLGPDRAGVLLVEDGAVTLRAADGAGLTVGGEPVQERVLATDAEPGTDVVAVDRIRFHVIDRDGRLGVRVKDPETATRTGFEGLDWYPVDPTYRVEAILQPFEEPREIEVPTVLGTSSTSLSPGLLRFTLGGEQLELTPTIASPDDNDLFIVFADTTSGDTTYGAGRFLAAELEADGTAVLDFNLAYSPPCAFTPYATCPLPPPGNRLPVAVHAGEKHAGHH